MKNPVRSQMSGRYRDCGQSMHCRFRARRTLHRKARAHNLDRHPFRARRRAAKSGRSPAAPSRPSPHIQGRPRVILRPARKIYFAWPIRGRDIYLYLYPLLLALPCEEYTPSTLDTYTFPNPLQHVNTVTMSELIIKSSAYIINGDSPMTSVANTVAMTTFAVHTLQPLIYYRLWAHMIS